jgi:hypothetical protein
MTAAESVLTDIATSDKSHEKRILLPQHFRLHHYSDETTSLGYADFNNLEVPAGYTPRRDTIPPTSQPTLAKDIVSNRPKTIGCPVTLLQGRLGELMDWGVELVQSRNLWDEQWPPAPK